MRTVAITARVVKVFVGAVFAVGVLFLVVSRIGPLILSALESISAMSFTLSGPRQFVWLWIVCSFAFHFVMMSLGVVAPTRVDEKTGKDERWGWPDIVIAFFVSPLLIAAVYLVGAFLTWLFGIPVG